MFADDYPRFMEVSELTPNPHRMNERYEALFASNRDIFDGARVLDLASHDGRYSFAALKTGAAHVTGVEVRESLVHKVSMYDWKTRLAGGPPMLGLTGYAKGKRVTLRCRSREAAIAAGWDPVAPLPVAASPRAGGRKRTPPLAQTARGWRQRANQALARATGYELRRASTKR